MSNKSNLANLTLMLAAVIWGFAFVAQRSGMEHIGPLLFNGIRFVTGGLILIPFYLLTVKKESIDGSRRLSPLFLWPGVILFIASYMQQKGIVSTTAGNAGFITGIYMVFVPIFGIFIGQKIPGIIWLAVPLSLAGLFLISFTNDMSFTSGDIWVFASALFWAAHVLIINWLVKKHDAILLALSQFLICGALSLFFAFISEPVVPDKILSASIPLLYGGIMSVGLAFTLQVVGQKNAHPAVASVILSSESLFAVLGGWLILSETMSVRQGLGCVLIFSAIIIIQVFQNKKQIKQYE